MCPLKDRCGRLVALLACAVRALLSLLCSDYTTGLVRRSAYCGTKHSRSEHQGKRATFTSQQTSLAFIQELHVAQLASWPYASESTGQFYHTDCRNYP
eukprot:6186557-Pleurochrysis_carterae.AAC.1